MVQAGYEKRLAVKVMWYFPIIPRLKRLFAIAMTAKLTRWHVEDRVNDGKLWHRLMVPSGELLVIVISGHFSMK
jgi:hypothetical protein